MVVVVVVRTADGLTTTATVRVNTHRKIGDIIVLGLFPSEGKEEGKHTVNALTL